MLLLRHQQEALDARIATATAFRLSGMDADTYIRLTGLPMCSRTLEGWGEKLDPNNPHALLDRRFFRFPNPYKLTDSVRIILLALWFMGRRNRRHKDHIVTVDEAIEECGELLQGDIFKASGEKLPRKSTVYALFADAKSLEISLEIGPKWPRFSALSLCRIGTRGDGS